MDKTAIKNFAISARKNLINEIKYQSSLLGITAEGIADPIKKDEGMEIYDIGGVTPYTIYDETIEQRNSLIKRINEKGYETVIEEVAYIWFNRIMAIRFMEVNDYLPTSVRVLSSTTKGKIEPDIVTESPNIDLNFSDVEIEQIYQLKSENKLDKLFKLLFIKQCNNLNEILPELFEETADYTELLLSISFTNENGIVRQLIVNIFEEDFKDQVEIIGWLYQYYISERKDQIININKASIKKEDIPAATQLFTPDWIVKYMVDNSLGRYWIERNPESILKNKLKYYLDEAEQSDELKIKLQDIRNEKISPEKIKFFDPCMGSGHILVYAFAVFVEIYKECGYSAREIPELVLKNNLFGLDIDDRAYQLAYLAIMMVARAHDRHIFEKNISTQICPIIESKLDENLINYISNDDSELEKTLNYINSIFKTAKETGSLIQPNYINFDILESRLDDILNNSKINLSVISIQNVVKEQIIPLLNQSKILSEKYDIIVTNPPYLNKMSKSLKNYTKSHYKNYSKDLFSIFIYRNFKFCKPHGYSALMSPFVWMFLQTYQDLREYIINEKSISSLIQLEYSAFSEATVPICTFVLYNDNLDYKGTYLKLSEFKGGMKIQNQKVLDSVNNHTVDYKYSIQKNNFLMIPGSPIAYWANENLINAFKDGEKLSSFVEPKVGLQTGDNDRFLRYWYEVNNIRIGFGFTSRELAEFSGLKWFPINKGGKFRKWYGNQEYILNWENDGYEMCKFEGSVIRNPSFYFKEGGTWTAISSGAFSVRYFENGFIISNAGMAIYHENKDKLLYTIGFLNSIVNTQILLKSINATLNFNAGDISNLPIIYNNNYNITDIVKSNIKIVRNDWNNFETSWNFISHPLLSSNEGLIEYSYDKWNKITEKMFLELKYNEERLNEIFIKIYNLESELNPKIDESQISIKRANITRDIKSFISYSVGCMFGRYSLDEEGLIFAGGQWNISKYSKFLPDDDNIVPILDTEYFEDDIVGRFVEFVKISFGIDNLEENLDFIAKALKKQGNTSRMIIRNYFLTDFYKDHLRTYKKHPIYWLFDSGKNNGFKALIYMHRYEADTVARVRTDYLHKTQKALETAIASNERIIENSTSTSEKAKVVKSKNILVKQLEETRKYDESLAHIANQKIAIDLDDGVKVNYAKFQGVEVSREGKKTKKIDLLKKI